MIAVQKIAERRCENRGAAEERWTQHRSLGILSETPKAMLIEITAGRVGCSCLRNNQIGEDHWDCWRSAAKTWHKGMKGMKWKMATTWPMIRFQIASKQFHTLQIFPSHLSTSTASFLASSAPHSLFLPLCLSLSRALHYVSSPSPFLSVATTPGDAFVLSLKDINAALSLSTAIRTRKAEGERQKQREGEREGRYEMKEGHQRVKGASDQSASGHFTAADSLEVSQADEIKSALEEDEERRKKRRKGVACTKQLSCLRLKSSGNDSHASKSKVLLPYSFGEEWSEEVAKCRNVECHSLRLKQTSDEVLNERIYLKRCHSVHLRFGIESSYGICKWGWRGYIWIHFWISVSS